MRRKFKVILRFIFPIGKKEINSEYGGCIQGHDIKCGWKINVLLYADHQGVLFPFIQRFYTFGDLT